MAHLARSKQKRELKSQRLELRVAPSTKAVILRAMAVSGLPAADLALQGAKQVLQDHERMLLRGADREAFLEAVRHPAAPSARLVEAFRLHAAKVQR
ncbi:MAG: type II toxin-antitoxin system TacA family antitoxin [Myxococcales bacterium]